MKLRFFTQTDGNTVAINPDYVHKILPKGLGVTLIRFERDDFVEVRGDLEQVQTQLESQ